MFGNDSLYIQDDASQSNGVSAYLDKTVLGHWTG